MKIAYIINQYPKVSHSFIRREILALERQGAQIQRIALRGWDAPTPDPQDREEMMRTNYVLRRGPLFALGAVLAMLMLAPARFARAFVLATRMSRRSDRSLVYHWIYFAEACVVARWLRQSNAEHMHAHFGTNAAEVAMLAGVLAERSYSFTVHGPEEFDRPEALGLPEKIRRAKLVVAISSFGRSQLYRWVGPEHWPKIVVVHCGVDAAFLRAALEPPPNTNRLVCVGRLCEQKGQLLLVSALQRLLQAGISCELVFAGDGEMREAVEHRARQLGVYEHIRITGWISGAQVHDELVAARALVLPSFAEGLPVVIMEAMALGRPVISTTIAGIPELVDSSTGWLVSASDVEALADAMRACLECDVGQLAEMGRLARERVSVRHDVDNEAKLLLQHFERFAAEPQTSVLDRKVGAEYP